MASAIRGSYGDWAVVLLFYAAVHYVEMYFAGQRADKAHAFPDHVARNQAVIEQLTTLWSDYRALMDESRNARYLCVDYSAEQVVSFTNEELARIKDRLRQLGVQIP